MQQRRSVRVLETTFVLVALALAATACGDDGTTPSADAGNDSGGLDGVAGDGGEDTVGTDTGDADAAVEGYSEPTGASGTRLRRIYMEGDGAYFTLGLWDTELGAQCRFEEAADGSQRCRPTDLDELRFADAGCSQPLMEMDPDSCTHSFARRRNGNAVYRRTDTPAVLSGRVFIEDATGGCRETGISVESPVVAEEVPSAMFVRGVQDDQPRADNMVARYIDGEDGSRMLQQVLHQTRGYECNFRGRAEGVCMPNLVPGFGSQFEDAACTRPLLGENSEANSVLAATGFGDCDDEVEYYEVGAEVTPATVYTNRSGACVPEVSRTRFYHRVGARVPVESLPQATRSLEGDGALQTVRYTDADGAPLAVPFAFWNSDTDRECIPAKHNDGSYRCLGASAGVTAQFWADSTCNTTPVAETRDCEPPPAHIIQVARSCESGIRAMETLFERGPVLASGVVYNDATGCGSQDFSSRLPNLFTAGAVLESTALPELTRMME